MSFTLRLPHYFHFHLRREMRQLYLATGIADVAIAMTLVFEPIFLYSQLGFTLRDIMLFYAGVYAFYIVFIPFGAKFAARVGYKWSMVASAPFQITFWLMLFGSQYNSAYLYFLPLLYACQKSLFWPAYHATITRYAHKDHVGREFSGLQALVNIAHIIGPLLGGLLAKYVSPGAGFAVAAILYLGMVGPLLWHRAFQRPETYKFSETWKLYKEFPRQSLGYMGFAEELLMFTVWPIYIFTQVSSFAATGAIVTVASLISAYTNLLVGKLSDKVNKVKLIGRFSLVYAMVWLARAFATGPLAVLAVDTAGRWSKDATFVAVSSITYQRAENQKNLPYLVFFEQSLAVGKLLAAILGIVLLSIFGASAFWPLFVLGGLATLLYTLL